LASSNKDFAWLRYLSELIVGLDGYMDAEEYQLKNVHSLMKYTKQVLTPTHQGGEFERLYFEAVQVDPVVLISHRKVMNTLKKKSPRKIDRKKKGRHT